MQKKNCKYWIPTFFFTMFFIHRFDKDKVIDIPGVPGVRVRQAALPLQVFLVVPLVPRYKCNIYQYINIMHIYTYIKHLSYLGTPTFYQYLIVLCFTICSVIFNITLACNSDQHHTILLCYVKEVSHLPIHCLYMYYM